MSKSVLIADDSPFVRGFLRTYLESEAGLRVCGEAHDGLDAINKALELEPDLVVMDLSMPQMNGLEAARKLKERRPDLPIVLFTSHSNAVCNADAAEAGINAVVSKSESPHVLASQIMELLAIGRQSSASGAP